MNNLFDVSLNKIVILFQGDRGEESHFLVLKHKDKGYVTIQSASQRGLFIGMTTDGHVHTTIDTGVKNIWLYPEVVECKKFYFAFCFVFL